MSKLKLLYVLLLSLIVLSCSKDVVNTNDQKVYQDIFPDLIEEVFQDFRKLPKTPPLPKEGVKESKEEMRLAFKKAKEAHKKYIDTTKFAALHIIVSDSIFGYSSKEVKGIYDEQYDNLKFIDTTANKESSRIDLSSIVVDPDYVLTYKSEVPYSMDELRKKQMKEYSAKERHLWQYSGMLNLYRVFFNENKDYGLMHVGYVCGKLCACAYRVFVKKENGSWYIDKITDLGCS